MKKINEFLYRITAVWALFSFLVTFGVFFIPSMLCWLIPEPQGQDLFIRLARIWMNIWLWLTGCRVKVSGRENFARGKYYVVTYNHNSLMDVPISCPYVPGPNKTIAKTSFSYIPLFGFYYMKGSVLVNRKNDESRRRSMDKMKEVLKKQMHMCIYPEGTRNRTSEPLKRFHDGAFRLARDAGHDIIPALIFHTGKVLPAGKGFYFRPHRLDLHFLPPVSSTAYPSHQELKNKVHEIMTNHYQRHASQKL